MFGVMLFCCRLEIYNFFVKGDSVFMVPWSLQITYWFFCSAMEINEGASHRDTRKKGHDFWPECKNPQCHTLEVLEHRAMLEELSQAQGYSEQMVCLELSKARGRQQGKECMRRWWKKWHGGQEEGKCIFQKSGQNEGLNSSNGTGDLWMRRKGEIWAPRSVDSIG